MKLYNWYAPQHARSTSHLYSPESHRYLCNDEKPKAAFPCLVETTNHKHCIACNTLSRIPDNISISSLAWFPSLLKLSQRYSTLITLYPLAATVYLIPWEQLHLLLLRSGLDNAFREAHKTQLFYYDGVPANLLEVFLTKK